MAAGLAARRSSWWRPSWARHRNPGHARALTACLLPQTTQTPVPSSSPGSDRHRQSLLAGLLVCQQSLCMPCGPLHLSGWVGPCHITGKVHPPHQHQHIHGLARPAAGERRRHTRPVKIPWNPVNSQPNIFHLPNAEHTHSLPYHLLQGMPGHSTPLFRW